jgi:hypothetical protein
MGFSPFHPAVSRLIPSNPFQDCSQRAALAIVSVVFEAKKSAASNGLQGELSVALGLCAVDWSL